MLRPVARIVASLKVLLAVGKYLQKHRDIFGDYKYGLPPRGWLEDDKLKAELNMTFLEWLQANDVQALMNFFIYSQARAPALCPRSFRLHKCARTLHHTARIGRHVPCTITWLLQNGR